MTLREDRIAPRLDAEQDATLQLLNDEGLGLLLENLLHAHAGVMDLTTRAAIRSAISG